MIIASNIIQVIGEQLKLRQQVISTAITYCRRFYSKYSLATVDILLICPSSLLLASKIDECGSISQVRMMNACNCMIRSIYPNLMSPGKEFSFKFNQMQDCEFLLVDALEFSLIVYHPYRFFMTLLKDSKYIAPSLNENDRELVKQLLPLAWRIANDSYRSDIILMYGPHSIGLASLYLASMITQRDSLSLITKVTTDFNQVLLIVNNLLEFYSLWRSFDERKEMNFLINLPSKIKSFNN